MKLGSYTFVAEVKEIGGSMMIRIPADAYKLGYLDKENLKFYVRIEDVKQEHEQQIKKEKKEEMKLHGKFT